MQEKLKQEYNKIILNKKICYRLNLKDFKTESTCLDAIANILFNGIQLIRLCTKNCDDKYALEISKKIKQLCSEYDAGFFIENRCDIAFLSKANGVYLKQCDIDISSAREILGQQSIIGIETSNKKEGEEAIKNGADFIGIPLKYSTPNKPALDTAGLEYAKWVSENLHISAFAEGYITLDNVREIQKTGIFGITILFKDSQSPNLIAEKLIETFQPQ